MLIIDLRVGDRVVTSDGKHGVIRRILVDLPDKDLTYGLNLDNEAGMYWYTKHSVEKEKY
jgi:hypothetical protein